MSCLDLYKHFYCVTTTTITTTTPPSLWLLQPRPRPLSRMFVCLFVLLSLLNLFSLTVLHSLGVQKTDFKWTVLQQIWPQIFPKIQKLAESFKVSFNLCFRKEQIFLRGANNLEYSIGLCKKYRWSLINLLRLLNRSLLWKQAKVSFSSRLSSSLTRNFIYSNGGIEKNDFATHLNKMTITMTLDDFLRSMVRVFSAVWRPSRASLQTLEWKTAEQGE